MYKKIFHFYDYQNIFRMTAIALIKKQEKMIDEIPSLTDFSNIFLNIAKSKYAGDYFMVLDHIIGLSE